MIKTVHNKSTAYLKLNPFTIPPLKDCEKNSDSPEPSSGIDANPNSDKVEMNKNLNKKKLKEVNSVQKYKNVKY